MDPELAARVDLECHEGHHGRDGPLVVTAETALVVMQAEMALVGVMAEVTVIVGVMALVGVMVVMGDPRSQHGFCF